MVIFNLELTAADTGQARLVTALLHFCSLLGGYVRDYVEGMLITLQFGLPCSLNPNTISWRCQLDLVQKLDGTLTLQVSAHCLPWQKKRVSQILAHRAMQLTGFLVAAGIAGIEILPAGDGTDVDPVQYPLVSRSPFQSGFSRSAKQSLIFGAQICTSVAIAVAMVVTCTWFYGLLTLTMARPSTWADVLMGTAGSGSVIGIIIGWVNGIFFSSYLLLSEISSFFNRTLVGFGLIVSLVLCFFMVLEEAVVISSLSVLMIPLSAYLGYSLPWSWRGLDIK
ncbi:MAG: hypothetical protein HQK56_05390 [Deltaproteobacteria bacterium]|nr:hypothetical protein [Deltaproteobacteria bacterium]